MSEIRANTISDAAGTGPVTLTKQSAIKCHGAFYHSGGTPVPMNTLNVSSLEDIAVGDTYVNLSNAMSGANFQINVSSWAYITWTGVSTGGRITNASKAQVYHTENGSGVDVSADPLVPIVFYIVGDLA